MNKIILMGRLTRDPEIKATTGGKEFCFFTLAVERPYIKGQKRETDFFNCNLWGSRAATFAKYFFKGQRALVEGRLQLRYYDDPKGGGRKLAAEIVVTEFDFMEPRGQGAVEEAPPEADATEYAQARPAQQQKPTQGGFESFGQAVQFDDNVPF